MKGMTEIEKIRMVLDKAHQINEQFENARKDGGKQIQFGCDV